jgi:hypothetical protein
VVDGSVTSHVYLVSHLEQGRLTATVTSSDSSVVRVWRVDIASLTVTVDAPERVVDIRLGPTSATTLVGLSGVTATLASLRTSPPASFAGAVDRTSALRRDAVALYSIAAKRGWPELAVGAIAVRAARKDDSPVLLSLSVSVFGIIRLPCDTYLCCLEKAREDYDRCIVGGTSDDECTDAYNYDVYYCVEEGHWSDEDDGDHQTNQS